MTARGMNARDLLRLRLAHDPQISPDGRRIAFVVTTLSEERDETLSAVWLVDADGGAPEPETENRELSRAGPATAGALPDHPRLVRRAPGPRPVIRAA
jgi:dipeptidyl aminopeptidase/acylaminoacyl peptidase